MSGQSKEFPIVINRLALAEISKRMLTEPYDPPADILEYEDFTVAIMLNAFHKYLEERNCQPDFKLALNE